MTAQSWSTACPDWERRIVARESLIPFAPLFPGEAESALEVFRDLRVADAGGLPMSQLALPWITDFVGSVFGAYDAEQGRRLITEFFMLISKKNSKSTTAAGIMITALVRNWRDSAEFLILAPTREIADNAFTPARDMVYRSEELSDLLHVQPNVRTITHRNNLSSLKVIAADTETVGGKKATGVLVDELWQFGKKPNAAGMLLEATGGLAARPEGFVIYLSTQSNEPPAGVFAEKLRYARAVRDGRIRDQQFLPVLYEFPEFYIDGEKYLDPQNFYITNPNLGASVAPEFIERKIAQARESGKAELLETVTKYLNVEIGLALRSDRWVGADFWESAARPGLDLDELVERSEVVCVGIDGGGLEDLLGLSVIGRDAETREWLTWSRAWVHASMLERRKQEAAQLRDFAEDGDLVLVDEVGQDTAELAEIVARIHASGKMQAGERDKPTPMIGLDPVGVGAILEALVQAGIPQALVIGISQGWKLNAAIKTAERKLAEGMLVHGGRPLMGYCVSNARVEPKGNAILITKQASGAGKIDPLMALFDAVAIMSQNPEPDKPPSYSLSFV